MCCHDSRPTVLTQLLGPVGKKCAPQSHGGLGSGPGLLLYETVAWDVTSPCVLTLLTLKGVKGPFMASSESHRLTEG